MTTIQELQRKILDCYKQKGKGINVFSEEIAALIDEGLSREVEGSLSQGRFEGVGVSSINHKYTEMPQKELL